MNDRDLIESLAKTLAAVAKTLELTRIELDGMRTLFIGTLAALSAEAAFGWELFEVLDERRLRLRRLGRGSRPRHHRVRVPRCRDG